jgi:trimethylamine-N-oxide reductase (cytochrome c)
MPSRRDFIKSAALAGVATTLPFSLSALATAVRDVHFVPSAGQVGAFWAMVQDGKFVKAIPRTEVDPRPTKMLSEGLVSRTYHKTRVLYPHVRKSYLENLSGNRRPDLRSKEEFVRVDWDTALKLTAKAVLDTVESAGNDAIFSSSYGAWAHGGVLTPNVLQGRFFNLIGGMSHTVGDYSGGAAQVAMPHVIGDMEVYSRQTSWLQVLKNTDIFVLVGVDPHKNGRAEGGTTDHSMYPHWEQIRDAGVKFLSINPQKTTSDDWLNSEWLPIIPNTDTALFLAMSQHLVENDLHDKAFLAKYTVGAAKFIDYLQGKDDGLVKTPEWAEKITGIEAKKIRELAELFNSKRTQIGGSWSIQRAQHGEMVYWAIISFSCMTGQIGLPGGGVGFSWHWGQGGALFAHAVTPAGLSQGKNPVQGICPASRIIEMLENPGGAFTHNGRDLTFPDVQLIYNAGNNFASHQQDTNRLLKAMEKVHTVVCHDPWWTAAARVADIVLPATSTIERDEISSGGTYSKDKVYAMRKIIEPLGESLDDFEIFRRLAVLFDVEQDFTGGKSRIDVIKGSYQKSTASTTKSFEEFWRDGIARVPIPKSESSWVRHGEFRTDPEKNPLATASGKIELYCETIEKMNIPDCPPMATWMEPAEYLGNATRQQVHVVSPHPYNRIHSQFAQADLRHELNVQDREFALINTEDAQSRGITDGDLVELSNERGSVIVGARVSEKIMPGVISVYEGAWLSWDSKGRCNSGSVNTLTSSRRASGLSQATTANTCLVAMVKANDIDGPNRAYEPPMTVSTDVKLTDKDFGLDRVGQVIASALDEMEEGAKIYYQKCSLCHTPRDPGSHTFKEWESITQSMFVNAGATPEERKLILSFLKANAKPSL